MVTLVVLLPLFLEPWTHVVSLCTLPASKLQPILVEYACWLRAQTFVMAIMTLASDEEKMAMDKVKLYLIFKATFCLNGYFRKGPTVNRGDFENWVTLAKSQFFYSTPARFDVTHWHLTFFYFFVRHELFLPNFNVVFIRPIISPQITEKPSVLSNDLKTL